MIQSVTLRHSYALLFAVLFGLLSMLPYALHTFSPLYRGLSVIRDKDFGNYNSRLERALEGFPEEADNGITPVGSGIEGLQEAGMEQGIAFVFRWTGLPAPTLSIFVTGLSTVLVFFLLFLFLRILEFSPAWALVIPILLFAVMFHVLTRVMHPGWSFVPTLAALIAFFRFTQKPSLPLTILSGILLGLLPSIYFWSFTFVWAAASSFVLLSLLLNWRENIVTKCPTRLVLVAILTIILAVPFFLHSAELFKNPLYPEIAVRASFLYQRTPESWPRSILLFVQLILFGSLWKQYKNQWNYLAVLSLLLGIFLAMHQNVLHGRILMFSSHYYPHLLIASTIVGAWVLVHCKHDLKSIFIVVISAVFLVAGGFDYFNGHRFFFPTDQTFEDQHLAPAIMMLRNNGTENIILTDAYTGRLLTSWSSVGIVYTTHSRFLFLSDAELAERFCVSEMFESRDVSDTRVLSLEYNRILQSLEYQKREHGLISEACDRVRKNPKEYLEKYAITHVLWNKNLKPHWQIDALSLGLRAISSGDGWVLWGVTHRS